MDRPRTSRRPLEHLPIPPQSAVERWMQTTNAAALMRPKSVLDVLAAQRMARKPGLADAAGPEANPDARDARCGQRRPEPTQG